jgi:hypothetical protein
MHQLYPFNATDCLRLTEYLVAIQAGMSCLESLYNSRIYRPAHLLDWRYVKAYRPLFTASSRGEKVFDAIFSYPSTLFLFGLRLVFAVYICWDLWSGQNPEPAVLLLCATGLAASMRNAYSNNGSDQLANIVLVVLAINILSGNTGFPRAISIFFIAFQGSLAYFTAGLLKATNKRWRNGNHLQAIMCTGFFGNRSCKYILDRTPSSYVTLSILLIIWEMTMGASPFLPPAICLAVLAGGVIFHLSVAVIMGFNTFLWAFLATYPAIYFVACKLH